MPVEVMTTPAGASKEGLSEKTYRLSAPPDLLTTQPPAFTINWIDFFR
jgi:hypothetical protein